MDHLGTPQMLTDGAGAVVWDASYRPFGDAAVTGSVAFNLRFPGQYFDAETGLANNWFRDYDASLGRYLESDPIGLAGGWNTYAYIGGNPVLFFDEDGLKRVPVRAVYTSRTTNRAIPYSRDNPDEYRYEPIGTESKVDLYKGDVHEGCSFVVRLPVGEREWQTGSNQLGFVMAWYQLEFEYFYAFHPDPADPISYCPVQQGGDNNDPLALIFCTPSNVHLDVEGSTDWYPD